MARPELVFNEPVATGAVRVELYGDAARAGHHLNTARGVLGMLRCMYGVNERIAAGEPGGFYVHRVLLADGTQIEALTNNGLDIVRIHAAPPPAPARRRAPAPPRRQVIRRALACGSLSVRDAFLWREGDERGVLPLPAPDGGFGELQSNHPTGVSANGEVSGFCLYTTATTSTGLPYRWSEARGYLMLDPGADQAAQAYAIAADGTAVVGAADAQPCYWTAAGALVPLAAAAVVGEARAVSANGARIGGQAHTGGDDSGARTYHLLLWTGGELTELASVTNQTGWISFGYVAMHMAADGSTLAWTEMVSGSWQAACWTEHNGITTIGAAGEFLTVVGVSATGTVVYVYDEAARVGRRWDMAQQRFRDDDAPAGATDGAGGRALGMLAGEPQQRAPGAEEDAPLELFSTQNTANLTLVRGGTTTVQALGGAGVSITGIAIATPIVDITESLP
jgi:hypothetical protein